MQVATTHAWPLATNELEPALNLILALARADMGVLMLHDETSGALFPVLGAGMDNSQTAVFGANANINGPFGRAMAEHRRVRVRNTLGFRLVEVLPFYNHDGRVLGAFGMMFHRNRGSRRRETKLEAFCADVLACAISHAEQHLEAERARERLSRTTQAKIQFLARMSHELRTPLQSIAGYVDLLRAGGTEPLTPSQSRMLARIAESERILVHVIDDVITFSRLEAGHVSYNIGPVSAHEALRVTEAVVSPLAIDHRVEMVVAPCSTGLLVRADGDKLKQILVNLAANAIKYTKPNATITLSAHIDADTVRFDVADTGPGIAEEKLREIFEPYVQLGGPVVDAFGGSGLGLTISREFASGMGGELTAASHIGQGSVFSLRLPRDRATKPSVSQATGETVLTVPPA
jgi:signal transduction histidine kinase